MTPRLSGARIAGIGLLVASYLAGTVVATVAGSALVVYVPYATVGAILVYRRPGNLIGWLLFTIAWGFALAWLPVHASAGELETLTAPPGALAIAWFKSAWSMPLQFGLIGVLAIAFPSGRLPGGRRRRPSIVLLASMGAITIVAALLPVIQVLPEGYEEMVGMPNPVVRLPERVLGVELAQFPAGALMFALLIGSIGSMLLRYRRASGVERLQLRWLVAGLTAVGVAVPLGLALFVVFGSTDLGGVAWVPAIIAFTLPPIAIGIAVLRYRLYEIDRLISRGLSWALLSALLVAVYAGAILVLQNALGGVTQGETLSVAASTLVAAALFQPLRVRVQRATDHRFDRARYDGERTAAAFAERLRQEVDLSRVSLELVAAAQVTVRPEAATVWLRGGRA